MSSGRQLITSETPEPGTIQYDDSKDITFKNQNEEQILKLIIKDNNKVDGVYEQTKNYISLFRTENDLNIQKKEK